jgi:hypothetical protein
MPTTGVSGVLSELAPSGAPPKGTTESAAGVAVAATATGPDLFLGERSVTAPPGLARPWVPEIVIPARTKTATVTGSPTARNARELPMCPMALHFTHPYQRESFGKRRDQFVGADVIRVMTVPNSSSLAGSLV